MIARWEWCIEKRIVRRGDNGNDWHDAMIQDDTWMNLTLLWTFQSIQFESFLLIPRLNSNQLPKPHLPAGLFAVYSYEQCKDDKRKKRSEKRRSEFTGTTHNALHEKYKTCNNNTTKRWKEADNSLSRTFSEAFEAIIKIFFSDFSYCSIDSHSGCWCW